jgi:hypothetical protein
VSANETVKAIGVSTGYSNSAVGSATYVIGGPTQIFNYTNFTSPSNLIINADAAYVGSVLDLTHTASNHYSGSVWYSSVVNIQSFTMQCTLQWPSGLAATAIVGMTFEVQNSSNTTSAVADANLCGYGQYGGQSISSNSIAIKFDLCNQNHGAGNYPAAGYPNTTGLFINGGPDSVLAAENDLNPYGVNLYTGDQFFITVVYDGTYLTMVIKDTTTNAQGRYVWPINIPTWVTANTAYVGITAGQNQTGGATQSVLNWEYWTGYNTRLATPTFSVTPGYYASSQSVSISGPVGALIYYTTNGLLPTSSSTLYTGPISVTTNTILNAVAIESNFTDSYVATGAYQIGATTHINFGSGFALYPGIVLTGYAYLNGSAIQLTDTTGFGGYHQVSAMWWGAPVTISTFSTTATIELSGGGSDAGMAFVIQNYPGTSALPSIKGMVTGGPTAIGQAGNGTITDGYGQNTGGLYGPTGGIMSSVAVCFNPNADSVGLYTNGATPTGSDTSITNLTLGSGHPITAAFSYNGTTLSLILTDTVTSGTQTFNWTVNIPSDVGANTAYVGFTGANGFSTATQSVSTWTFN